jgi:hypothetical protein
MLPKFSQIISFRDTISPSMSARMSPQFSAERDMMSPCSQTLPQSLDGLIVTYKKTLSKFPSFSHILRTCSNILVPETQVTKHVNHQKVSFDGRGVAE